MTLSTTNQFINCEPDIRLARMKDVTGKALDKIQRRSTIEKEMVAAAGLVKSLCGFIGGFISAYPPAAMALSGVATILPVSTAFGWII